MANAILNFHFDYWHTSLSTNFKTATTLLILRCRAAIAFTMVIIVVVNLVVLSLWDQNMDECDLGPN